MFQNVLVLDLQFPLMDVCADVIRKVDGASFVPMLWWWWLLAPWHIGCKGALAHGRLTLMP